MEQQSTAASTEKADRLRTMADITPLEPPIDSFNTSTEQMDTGMKGADTGKSLASFQTHTPPETPEQLPPVSTMDREIGNDIPLFPDSPIRDRSRSFSPLLHGYKDSVGKAYQAIIDRNEHGVSTERFQGRSYESHRRNDSATYPGILGIKTAQDALDFHRSLVDEQRRWRVALSLPAPARSRTGAHRDATSRQQLSRLNKSSGVTKPRSASPPPLLSKPVAITNAPVPRKASKTTKPRAEKTKAASEAPSDTGATVGTKKHTRAAPTKNVTNKEWRQLDDYSPPASILDGKTHEVRWHGNKIDLSEQPDVQFLHELEVKWASRLRLSPGQYLAIKRLIFRGKVHALREGKSFTKTAAQNVASLDVNKLSRLHEAFDAVGWFEERHFEKYLQAASP